MNEQGGEDKRKSPGRRNDDLVPKLFEADPPKLSEKSAMTAQELRGQLRVLMAVTVLLFVVIAILVWWTWNQALTNTKSLCAVRREAQAHVNQGEQYLQTHPNGIAGVTAAQIQQSINDSNDTVNALTSLGGC